MTTPAQVRRKAEFRRNIGKTLVVVAVAAALVAAFVAFLDIEVIGASSTGFSYCGRVAGGSVPAEFQTSWCTEALAGYAMFVWASVGVALIAAAAAVVILVKTPRY